MSNHILSLIPRHGLAHSVAAQLSPVLQRAVEAPVDWIARMRDRRQLAAMSDSMLKDIGVSRADAEHEVEKHFWQA
jgi:uncharacterized protein YjiS (DUF1127 family)